MENKKWVNRIIQAAIILIIAVFTFQIIIDVNKVQVATNILDDTHQMTSLTERSIKLALANKNIDDIQLEVTQLWSRLFDNSDKGGIERITYQGYTNHLQNCFKDYQIVEKNLQTYQGNKDNEQELISSSEQFYKASQSLNEMMTIYSLGLIEKLKIYELFLIIFVIALIVVYFRQLLIKMRLTTDNGELKILTYLDEPTNLPNQRRCRELLSQLLNFEKNKSYACIMFDLNNLKWVNDTYGHKFGDVLIASFSSILHKYINDDVFIGRYGGDEFIAIITNYDDEQIKQMILCIQNSVEKFNDEHLQIPIKFAYGYDIAYKGKKIKMEEIVERADINMYKCKKRMKDELVVKS